MQLLKLNSCVNYDGVVWKLTKITKQGVYFSYDTPNVSITGFRMIDLNSVIAALDSGDMTHA